MFRYLEREDMAPLLKTLVQEAALPLKAIETTFAIDSTGFATNTYSRWLDEKYGGEKKCQRWVKAHAQVGTVTNVITAIEVTESNVGDAPMLAPLLKSTVAAGFDVREVSADKAYLSKDLPTAIEAAHAVPMSRSSRTVAARVATTQDAGLGHGPASASMAFRLARLANVTVDDLLTGKFPPPGICPHCGYATAPPTTP